MKSAVVHSRIDPEIKEKAESVLHRLGLSPTEAIRMFYTQITLHDGLPFAVCMIPHIPNAATAKVLDDSSAGRNVVKVKSLEELFASWDAL